MGRERGPIARFEGPRSEFTRIEGQLESSFTEIDMDQASHIPLPDSITWPTARLHFQQVGQYMMREQFGIVSQIQLYTGHLEYRGKKKKARQANLSLLTSKAKPVLFTGTRNGFYAHDSLTGGRNEPFYIVGLQPHELEQYMSRMSAVEHELGHTLIYHHDLDTQLFRAAVTLNGRDLPPVEQARKYGNVLAVTLPRWIRDQNPSLEATRQELAQIKNRSYDSVRAVSLFHERNAWAAGMKMVRAHEFPTGFRHYRSYFDYAMLCLSTYANHFNDTRFTKGFK